MRPIRSWSESTGKWRGLIHFRRSDRLEAASALRRLRSKRNLQVGIISELAQPS